LKGRKEKLSISNMFPVNICNSICPSISLSFFLNVLNNIEAIRVPPALIHIFRKMLARLKIAGLDEFLATLIFWRFVFGYVQPCFLKTTGFSWAFWTKWSEMRLIFEKPGTVGADWSWFVRKRLQLDVFVIIHESQLTIVLSLNLFFKIWNFFWAI